MEKSLSMIRADSFYAVKSRFTLVYFTLGTYYTL